MEKISFTHKETGETVDFYVLEETRLNGVDYILVTDSQEDDGEALILKDLSSAKYSILKFAERSERRVRSEVPLIVLPHTVTDITLPPSLLAFIEKEFSHAEKSQISASFSFRVCSEKTVSTSYLGLCLSKELSTLTR